MLRHYIWNTIQVLKSNRVFSGLGILNLAIGLTLSLSMLFIYWYENGYDREVPDSDRIYRIIGVSDMSGTQDKSARLSLQLEQIISRHTPGIETLVRVTNSILYLVTDDGKKRLHPALAVDSTYFNVFGPTIILGEKDRPLHAPNSMVISKSEAIKRFGSIDVIGRSFLLSGRALQENFTITAVMDDPSEHLSLKPHYLVDFQFYLNDMSAWFEKRGSQINVYSWSWKDVSFYAKFVKNVSIAGFSEEVRKTLSTFEGNFYLKRCELQSLHDVYLGSSNIHDSLHKKGEHQRNTILLITSIIVLTISALNLVVLSSAQINYRLQEIGVRKSLGASRKDLITQFAVESLLVVITSGLISALINISFVPALADLLGIQVPDTGFFSIQYIGLMIAVILIVGLAIGAYGALYVSRLNTVSLQSGGKGAGGGNPLVFRLLTLFQIALVVGVFMSMGIVANQLNCLTIDDLGFDTEGLVMVELGRILGSNEVEALAWEISKESYVEDFAVLSPPLLYRGYTTMAMTDLADPSQIFNLSIANGTPNIISFLGLQLEQGSLAKEGAGTQIFLNEMAAKRLYPNEETVVGKAIIGSQSVSGVVRDFHLRAKDDEITPLAIIIKEDMPSAHTIMIKTRAGSSTKRELTQVLNAYFMKSGRKVQIYTLPEKLQMLFENERNLLGIIRYLVLVTILIAGIGLYSVSYFIVARRLRDYSVLRILGISPIQLMGLMLSEFLLLTIIATTIAIPLAVSFMDTWIQRFYYKAHLTPWSALLPSLATLAIVALTVLVNYYRVIKTKPVRVLNKE